MKTNLHVLCVLLGPLAGIPQTAARAATVFPIATNPAVIAYGTGIAFDGANYLVEGLTGTNANEVTNVSVQLVSASGALLGSPLAIGGGASLAGSLDFRSAGLCFGNTNYLVGWSDGTISSGVDIFGQLISRSGAKVGSTFNLLASQGAHGFQIGKALASDGTNYLVVWQDTGDSYVYGQLVTPAGTLSGSEFLISSAPEGEASIAVTFGKTNYLGVAQNISAETGGSNQVYGVLISLSGLVGASFHISQSASTDQSALAVGFDGTNYLVVWPSDPGPETGQTVTNWQLHARLVSQAGTFPGNEIALITNGNQVVPSLAFDGANYLLTCGFDSNTTNSDRNLRCQFLDPSANLVGPLFTPLAPQGTNSPLFAFHGILFDGSRFVMAATLGTLGTNGEVYGAFIPASTTRPTLAATGPRVGTQFPLLLTGTPGINYAIQMSTNLVLPNWTGLVTNSPTNGVFTFTDTAATNRSRFYRALKQ